MRRWILPALAAVLTGCVSADGGATTGDRAAAFANGQCFRASDVTNYNVEAPHAVFVRTNRGYVFGLVSDNCFDDNTSAVSLAQSRRANLWICAGDEAEVNVGTFPCMARVTTAIVDEDVSGFRGRAAQG
ncbi:MAG: hypothetical protein KKG14_06240 [Alphaproteobacteria bacterium]|nr:hypothetical protein [Alphaproteobacteria bacterium]MBU2418280.1 hypothetical protein [Alphaproteobacteria bacterium]